MCNCASEDAKLTWDLDIIEARLLVLVVPANAGTHTA
jgi:hypothetical protein